MRLFVVTKVIFNVKTIEQRVNASPIHFLVVNVSPITMKIVMVIVFQIERTNKRNEKETKKQLKITNFVYDDVFCLNVYPSCFCSCYVSFLMMNVFYVHFDVFSFYHREFRDEFCPASFYFFHQLMANDFDRESFLCVRSLFSYDFHR